MPTDPSLVRAPYAFVPLSGKVHEVPWSDRISQDVPFEDGICGHLEVTLVAETPLCVGSGERDDDEVRPFRTLDGELAIPGTSIKGMLRNVVEIASFSKMQLVDRSRRFAVRDLNNAHLYRDQMTKTLNEGNRRIYEARPRPGWLELGDAGWTIEPCEVARVEQQDLLKLAASAPAPRVPELRSCFSCQGRTPPRASTGEKYQAWEACGLSRAVTFDLDPAIDHPLSNGQGYLRFRRAIGLGSGSLSGVLVFTGQPSANKRMHAPPTNSGKHREFLFYGTAGPVLRIHADVRKDFELNHSLEQAQRHGGQTTPNEEWRFWLDQLQSGTVTRVPVFFLADGGTVRSLGLTQMYRLAYRWRIGDLIDQTSRDHRPDPLEGEEIEDHGKWQPPIDFAEALFGYVRSHPLGGEGAKGRVSVGLFRCTQDIPAENEGEHHAILSSPKPTYYPAYVDQSPRLDPSRTRLQGGQYLTYMDGDAEIRGWKRYPVRPQAEPLALPPEGAATAQERVEVHWRTVPRETRFSGKVRVHNLRPVELGALLWALDFGGAPGLFHSLGLAKPFGYGRVRLEMTESSGLRQVLDGSPVDLATAREAFAAHMELAIPGWTETEQLVQLRAMADPSAADSHDLTYMKIGQGPGTNEFVAAKQAKHALPPYAFFGGRPDRERYPRGEAQHRWQERLQEVRRAAETEKREAEEAKERERRESLGAAGRLREDHDEMLALPLADQVEALLGIPREVPREETADPSAWVHAITEVFAPAVEEARRRAEGGAGERLAKLQEELAAHLDKKPEDKRGKPFRKWKRTKEEFERKVAEAGHQDEAAQRRASIYGEFLVWLEGLSAREAPAEPPSSGRGGESPAADAQQS